MDSLQKIFEFLRQLFKVNIYYPSTGYKTHVKDVNEQTNVMLEVTRFHHKVYKLTIGTSALKIDEKNLERLLELEPFIRQTINQLHDKRIELESCFFEFLHTYFEHYRTVHQLLDFLNLQSFFDHMMTSTSGRISKSFVLETAIYFARWMHKVCIPSYVQTVMLNEKYRMDSFRGNWPHSHLDAAIMARTGLYLLGNFDRVKCAFCQKEIEKWKVNDNPIKDHFAFSPYCPLLNEMLTANEPLETSDTEMNLSECLQSIPRGFDEIDHVKQSDE